MVFNDEEKRIVEKNLKYGLDNPLSAIIVGLSCLYHPGEEDKEFIAAMHNCAKRMLIEIAEKRKISGDFEASFELSDIINDDNGVGITPEEFLNQDELKKIIEDKTKDMNYHEIEELSKKIGGFKSLNDKIRVFMDKYINKINSNLYLFDLELSQQETDGFDPFSAYDEVNQEGKPDFSWAQGQIEEGTFEWAVGEDFDDAFVVEDKKEEEQKEEEKDEGVSDEELVELIKYLNTYSQIGQLKENVEKTYLDLQNRIKAEKLQEYKSHKEFYSELEKMMKNDPSKNKFLLHGVTAVSTAKSILKQGLGMGNEFLKDTTYPYYDYDYSIDKVLVYNRGLAGEIGSKAIVVIDQPIDENGKLVNIVRPVTEDDVIDFQGSGLKGLDGKAEYMVEKKYIIGYINKKDKEIVYNEAYYDYDRFSKQKEEGNKTISAKEGLRNAIGNVDAEIVNEANKDMNEDVEKTEDKDV